MASSSNDDGTSIIAPSNVDDHSLPDEISSETNDLPGGSPPEKQNRVNSDPDFSQLLGHKENNDPQAKNDLNKINMFDEFFA